MPNARIILECPNCKQTKEVENRYDHNLNEQLSCDCGLTVSKWCWNYICNIRDLPNKDKEYGAPLEENNGICNSNIP